jgi:hypothetical protein
MIETLWEFIRGDLSTSQFEQWAYTSEELESQLGTELHLETVSTDFRSDGAVYCLKRALEEYAHAHTRSRCRCVRLADLAVVDMGVENPEIAPLEILADRSEPQWWLALARCRECGQSWLYAEESRIDDVWVLRRLCEEEAERIVMDGRWPSEFDSYERLLRIANAAGRHVRWLDPLEPRGSVQITMAELAVQNPDITLGELATLLSIDLDDARILAERVNREHHVAIHIG